MKAAIKITTLLLVALSTQGALGDCADSFVSLKPDAMIPLLKERISTEKNLVESKSRHTRRTDDYLAPYEIDFDPIRSIDSKTQQERLQAFIEIKNHRKIFIDYLKAAPGKPTVVLLNGLTYRTGIWDAFVKSLKGDGLGILRYDPAGMGKTLARDISVNGLLESSIEIDAQAKDLSDILNSLNIRDRVHVVGLSYGGALAVKFATTYPKKIGKLILMAPFTKPLESQDNAIKLLIAQTRLLFPLNPATNDQLYDFFLRQMIYTTYPLVEPIVLEYPWKLEATYRLVQGVRKFYAEDVAKLLPESSVHLMVGAADQYIPAGALADFWGQVPESARQSRVIINFSEHKIPESVPVFSANWVRMIINGDPNLQKDVTWYGQPFLGSASSRNETIRVESSPQGPDRSSQNGNR